MSGGYKPSPFDLTVVRLRTKAKIARPQPIKIVHEDVTQEERAAAYELLCKAQALQRLFDRTWTSSATLATAPGLIAEAREALDVLQGLLG